MILECVTEAEIDAIGLFCHNADNAHRQYLGGLLESDMQKEKLIEKIKEILKTDLDLSYLSILKQEELESLIACIRYRVDQRD